ncbi:hypothetical protein CR513_49543, partial [Mucuna pruriens]
MVKEEEAIEFLKIIRHSEYELMDQLNKTLACMSLLSLLISSEGHRQLLLKVLNEAFVTQDITEKFGGIVNNITANNYLFFSEEEILVEGKGHNQPLHISVKCGNYMLVRVLIGNGSSLNVMPKATLDKLYSTDSKLKANFIVVQAFDGSRGEVMGKITLSVWIGRLPLTSLSKKTLDPCSRHSPLLLTPKIEIYHGPTVGIVLGENDLMISTSTLAEYIEGDEEALKTSFQSLEIVGTTCVEIRPENPRPSKAARVLLQGGYQLGHKLGEHLEGMTESLKLQENEGQRGLGYHMPRTEEKTKSRLSISQSWILLGATRSLYEYFKSRGVMPSEQVAMMEDQAPGEQTWVYIYDEEPTNWTNLWSNYKKMVERRDQEIQPHIEGVEVINLGKERERREVKSLIDLLVEYSNVFAWSYQDMLGLDSEIVEHKLPLLPNSTLVQQKLRRTKSEVTLKIKEEVEKQLKAGFLVVVEYPQWVAMPVPKKDGKLRMFVDYRNLNRFNPKDNFLLPYIDVLVDNTT